MNSQCPACGSADIRVEQVQKSVPVPYGQPAAFVATRHTCNVCEMSGDFTGENDERITKALNKSESASAEVMLRWLSEHQVTSAYFERALRLPARTTNRWKSGEVSAAALALLRMIRTYPWLLEVSDANFKPSVAAGTVLHAAANLLSDVFHENVKTATLICARTETQITVAASLWLKREASVVSTEAAAVPIIIQPLSSVETTG
jgi:hypothetical protein